MLGCLLLAGSPAQAAVTDLDYFAWQWEPGVRYFIEVSVGGVPMWWTQDLNRRVVILGFTLQVVTRCHSPERETRRSYEVRCDIEDVAIQASPRQSDAGLTQDVIEEMVDKLKDDTWMQVRLRDDGSLVNFQLGGLTTRTRTQGRMAETMRLVLMRGLAGLDMKLPTRPADLEYGIWPQYQSAIAMYPSAVGTAGGTEMAHLAKQRSESWLVIESAGKATISPQGGRDVFDTRIESRTVFDMERGRMVERLWVAEGWATAGSASSEGGSRPYLQAGRLFVIEEIADVPQLMHSEERGPGRTRLSDREAQGGLGPDAP